MSEHYLDGYHRGYARAEREQEYERENTLYTRPNHSRTEAYNEGREAYEFGGEESDNPYDKGTVDFSDWEEGYLDEMGVALGEMED